ncbi:TPA: hypothetical protein R4289_000420 [Enterobacter mori]|nr:hypothetical protein [Enterobacter mori]
MVILQKIRTSLNMSIFILCAMSSLSYKVHSSERYVNVVGSHEGEHMICGNQESIAQAIDTVLNIISQKSSLEEQVDKYKEFFDRVEPHFPKIGPVSRYYISHKREVEINFFRDKKTGEWNSAYISFGACSGAIKNGFFFNLDDIENAQLSFEGVYENEGAYPDNKGMKVIYKFKVARYLYKYHVVADFKLTNEELSGEVYPMEFSRVHVYIGG